MSEIDTAGARDQPRPNPRSLAEHIDQNVETLISLQRREIESVTPSQRRVEQVSRVLGRPAYLVGILVVTVLWAAANMAAASLGFAAFDPSPFPLLDTVLTLSSLATATIVLIAQNRQARLERQQAQLDLQVSLLTEQKVTKLIHLIEELRRDLPMVRDRHDPHAAALQESADAATVLEKIETLVQDEGAESPSPKLSASPKTSAK